MLLEEHKQMVKLREQVKAFTALLERLESLQAEKDENGNQPPSSSVA
jgi:hypothetical protein